MHKYALKSEPKWVSLEIFAIIHEYHQVKVRSSAGNIYALTKHAEGYDIKRCREGARVRCLVTTNPDLPRVLRVDFDD